MLTTKYIVANCVDECNSLRPAVIALDHHMYVYIRTWITEGEDIGSGVSSSF